MAIRAEASEGEAPISISHENAIRRVLNAAGIEFLAESQNGVGVRLGKAQMGAASRSRQKAEVIIGYLQALQARLRALRSGDTEIVQGSDAIAVLFPPGASEKDLDPRAEAIINTLAEGCRCDYDYDSKHEKLRFIKR
jgi:hypothetical protein